MPFFRKDHERAPRPIKYTKQLVVRLSEVEERMLLGLARQAGLTRTQAIRQMIIISRPVSLDALNEIRREINHVGINLNQLTKVANTTGIDPETYKDTLAGCSDFIEILQKMRKGI